MQQVLQEVLEFVADVGVLLVIWYARKCGNKCVLCGDVETVVDLPIYVTNLRILFVFAGGGVVNGKSI